MIVFINLDAKNLVYKDYILDLILRCFICAYRHALDLSICHRSCIHAVLPEF